MTDKPKQHLDAVAVDTLLQNAFPPAPPLSGDFEQAVMATARRRGRRPVGQRVLLIMGLYWAAAGLLSAWLLASGPGGAGQPATPGSLAVVLAVIAIPAAGIAVMTGLARIRLSELFIGTLHGADEVPGPPVTG